MGEIRPSVRPAASFLVSISLYVALGALLSWLAYTLKLRPMGVVFDPASHWSVTPWAWLRSLWLDLWCFAIPLWGWWTITMIAEIRWQSSPRNYCGRAEAWLLLSALAWSAYAYAEITRTFIPFESFDCHEGYTQSERAGLGFATCSRPAQAYSRAIVATTAALYLIGLISKLVRLRQFTIRQQSA